MTDDLRGLADAIRAFAERHDEATRFLALWPEPAAAQRAVAPSILPVVRFLDDLSEASDADARDLIARLRGLAGRLRWGQTYTRREVGRTFLDRYGWAEIVGHRGPIPSEVIAAGFLLLGSGAFYPPHSHQAEEIYLPLAGRAEWLRGEDWTFREPGSAIHHPAFMRHAMRTGSAPLLALYFWRGGNLTEKSRLG